jgi:hypothetical protein
MKRILIIWVFLEMVCCLQAVAENGPGISKPTESALGELVVRIYNDWCVKSPQYCQIVLPLEEQDTHKKIVGRLQGSAILLKPMDPFSAKSDTGPLIVIISEDQKDPKLKARLRDSIYAHPYKPDSKPLLTLGKNKRNKDNYWKFMDAFGNPISGLTVDVYLGDELNAAKAFIRTVKADDQGRVKIPPLSAGRNTRFFLSVWHPDYGNAIIRRERTNDSDIKLPLAKAGDEADTQAIWGKVVDPDGLPVDGAMITCSFVISSGGGSIRTEKSGYGILTDEAGRFRMCVTIRKSDSPTGKIPPNAKYSVSIKSPTVKGLLPYVGRVKIGQETTITLDKGLYFHKFGFEDANGPITNPARLREFTIVVEQTDGKKYSLKYGEFKQGAMLRPGTCSIWNNSNYNSVEVTPESPKHLVFKAKHIAPYALACVGEVVNGLTNVPMAGAFALVARGSKSNFSTIDEEEWRQLNDLPQFPDINDARLDPIRELREINQIVRADNQGQFHIVMTETKKFDRIIVFAKDFLPIEHVISRKDIYLPDQQNVITLRPSNLFPAAKVLFEPRFTEIIQVPVNTYLRFVYWDNTHVPWRHDFFRWNGWLVMGDDFSLNKPNSIHVPANLNLRVIQKLSQRGRNGRSVRWCPLFSETVFAQQGETVDLGSIVIRKEMPVFVKLIDSAGNPLEGITVMHRLYDFMFGQSEISDANGLVGFHVPPHYEASFSVGWKRRNLTTPWNKLDYQTNGPEDANSIFTMQLSDELIAELRK